MGAEYVDDPDLPCAYCCGWKNDPTDDAGQASFPVDVRGRRLERLYRHPHPECAESVALYMVEQAGY